MLILFFISLASAQIPIFVRTYTITYNSSDCSGQVVKVVDVLGNTCSAQSCTNGVEVICTGRWQSYNPPENNLFNRYRNANGSTDCSENLDVYQPRERFRDRTCIPNSDGSFVKVSCFDFKEWVLENFTDSECSNRQSINVYQPANCYVDFENNNSWFYSCGAWVTNPPTTTSAPNAPINQTTGSFITHKPSMGLRIGSSITLLLFILFFGVA